MFQGLVELFQLIFHVIPQKARFDVFFCLFVCLFYFLSFSFSLHFDRFNLAAWLSARYNFCRIFIFILKCFMTWQQGALTTFINKFSETKKLHLSARRKIPSASNASNDRNSLVNWFKEKKRGKAKQSKKWFVSLTMLNACFARVATANNQILSNNELCYRNFSFISLSSVLKHKETVEVNAT